MIQKIKIFYGEDLENLSIFQIDTNQVQFSFANNVGIVGNYTSNLALTMGTIDHTFKFKDFFNNIKNKGIENISRIVVTDENDSMIYEITNKINSMIYNVNFSGMGDSITFDCKEE